MTSGRAYINDFVKLKCAPDLLAKGLFPNAKEITESFGCFWAVINHLLHLEDGIKQGEPFVRVYVVGDGTKPRTAATFAYRTKWDVVSIDPTLVMRNYGIERLSLCPLKVEEWEGEPDNNPIIIVLPHSHAPMGVVLAKLKSTVSRHVVSLPCCVTHDIQDHEYIGYVDQNIWSPKNTIKIWRNV